MLSCCLVTSRLNSEHSYPSVLQRQKMKSEEEAVCKGYRIGLWIRTQVFQIFGVFFWIFFFSPFHLTAHWVWIPGYKTISWYFWLVVFLGFKLLHHTREKTLVQIVFQCAFPPCPGQGVISCAEICICVPTLPDTSHNNFRHTASDWSSEPIWFVPLACFSLSTKA